MYGNGSPNNGYFHWIGWVLTQKSQKETFLDDRNIQYINPGRYFIDVYMYKNVFIRDLRCVHFIYFCDYALV